MTAIFIVACLGVTYGICLTLVKAITWIESRR